MSKSHSRESSNKLKQALRRLNPNVPAGLDDHAPPRMERPSNALRQLRTHVSTDPLAKVLLTGHIGVGKSTELLYLAREMQTDRFVIQCSISPLGAHNIDTFTLLIVVLESCIRAWADRLGNIPPGLIENLTEHVRSLVPETKKPSRKTENPTIEALLSLQGLLGEKPGQIKTAKELSKLYTEVLQRLALRYIPNNLRAALDPSVLAMSCEVLLKELENAAGQPILLVIDDLDKSREENAQADIFIDRAMAWIRLPCGVIATLPYDALFSSRANEIDQVWGDIQVLDPWTVPDLVEGGPWDESLQPYLGLLRGVGATDIITPHQCRKLAHAASGLPRAFINACGTCVRYALEAGENHVRDYQVDLVLRDLTDKWRGRLNDSDYKALISVLDSGGSNVPKAIKMLRDGILIRDASAAEEKVFRLASWAVPLVEAYRKRNESRPAVAE